MKSIYYDLFELMSREHGLTLLETELQEIVQVAAGVEDGWISAKERLPESGRKVLFFYKNTLNKNRTIVGHYLTQYAEECACDLGNECGCEYLEEKDNYYYPAGWYEQVDNGGEWSAIAVIEGTPTHWRPLPQPPEANKC